MIYDFLEQEHIILLNQLICFSEDFNTTNFYCALQSKKWLVISLTSDMNKVILYEPFSKFAILEKNGLVLFNTRKIKLTCYPPDLDIMVVQSTPLSVTPKALEYRIKSLQTNEEVSLLGKPAILTQSSSKTVGDGLDKVNVEMHFYAPVYGASGIVEGSMSIDYTEETAMTQNREIHTGGGNYNESINTGGGNYVQGNYINMSQDLTHAANQIQDLIEQLQKSGLTVDVAQAQVARNIATQVHNNPMMKDQLLKWGQSLGDATVSDVIKGIVKLAIRSAGIPLP